MGKKVIKNAGLINGKVADLDLNEMVDELGEFTTHEEKMRRHKYFEEKQYEQEKEYFKVKQELEEMKKEYNIVDKDTKKVDTSFIFTYFKEQQILFPDLKAQDVGRLIFISTYCEYGTNLLKCDGIYINKSRLKELMNLNNGIYYEWLEKMEKYKYIKFQGDKIVLNKSFFNYGKLKDEKDTKAVRLFIDVVRELYNNLLPRDHYKMGLMLQLIPFVNPHFNCLVENPKERNKENLRLLKLGSLAEKLGYSARHCRRLGNELLSLRFGEEQRRVVIAIALDNMDAKDHILMFNARLFFGGNIDEYEALNSMFDHYSLIEADNIDNFEF